MTSARVRVRDPVCLRRFESIRKTGEQRYSVQVFSDLARRTTRAAIDSAKAASVALPGMLAGCSTSAPSPRPPTRWR